LATTGVIEPAPNTIKTDLEEHLHIVAGSSKAKLPGAAWRTFAPGQTFIVLAKPVFAVAAADDAA